MGKNRVSQDLWVHDEVKVRLLQLPPIFDDKGKRKRPSQKELEDMKGPDKKLPGYTASLDDLKPGQVVRVRLIQKAGFKPGKGKERDKEIPDEYKPQVDLIVIVSEPVK